MEVVSFGETAKRYKKRQATEVVRFGETFGETLKHSNGCFVIVKL